MRRRVWFDGSGTPFEGDHLLWVRSIPDGARLTSAALTITPVAAPQRPLFEETLDVTGGVNGLGASQTRGTVGAGPLFWTELDFHGRRTVTRIWAGGLEGAQVQVDLGGFYVQLDQFGAPMTPSGTAMTLSDGGELPAVTATRLKLTHTRELPVSAVSLRSAPSNLLLRTAGMPALWSRPGELAVPITTPDLAAVLQDALVASDVEGGYHQLLLVLHSDTLCRVDVELVVEFVVVTPVLPGGLSETTVTYDYAGAPATASAVVTLPAGGRLVPTVTRARALGAFQASRVGYGPVGPVIATGAVAVTGDRSAAVPVVVPDDLQVTAVDLLVAASTPTARLQLDVVADIDGKPWNQPLLSRPAALTVERGDDPAAAWVSAGLARPFTFLGGVRYWVTLQVDTGAVDWSTVAAGAGAGPGTQATGDGGLSWRQSTAPGIPKAAALLRLRTVPAEFTMPVVLEVGAGAAARRIPLDRFAPLGRVEIDLNAPELIEGVSAVAEQATASCPTGEHVRNGDFALWQRTADQPTGSTVLDAGFPAQRLAASQDCVVFVAGGTSGGEVIPAVDADAVLLQMGTIDRFADIATARIPALIDAVVLNDLAADPAGRRGYALMDGRTVMALDADTGLTASVTLTRPGARALAISADGRSLYVAASTQIDGGALVHTVTAIPADLVRPGAGGPLGGVEMVLADPPVDVVVNGSTLFVLCTGDGQSSLLTVDATGLTVLGDAGGIRLAADASRIGVGAGGTVVAAVHPGWATLSVVDPVARTVRTVDLTANDDAPGPSAVAVSPSGAHAFVTLAVAGAVAVVDLATATVVRRIPVGAAPSDCAVTADGERVYVADTAPTPHAGPAPTGFTTLWVGTLLPEDWVVTAGTVRPYCAAAGGRVALVGTVPDPSAAVADAAPPATAGLGQVVPVAGGCRYELTFAGLASADGATVEVRWRSADGAVSRTDVVAVTPAQRGRRATAWRVAPTLLSHRLPADAPAAATQAELRVQAPPGIAAAVTTMSLRATASVLPNSADGVTLDGWRVSPAGAAGFTASADGELVLSNAGAAPVTVSQAAVVTAGRGYLLFVDMTVDGPSTPSAGPAVQLAWTSRGNDLGPVFSVPVGPGTGPVLRLLPAPPGVDGAALRLLLPPGTRMRLHQISLQAPATVDVPVTFVAHSPGELTLTEWQVAYDVDETPRVPPIPPAGLFPPGTPLPVPGEGGPTTRYCATCQAERTMADPRRTVTATGTPATAFACTHCGATVTLPGIPHEGATTAAAPMVVTTAPGLDVAGALMPRQQAPPLPLDAVQGIGPVTARRLNAIGVVAMADLATVPVHRLAALPGVTPSMARAWIERALTWRRSSEP